MEARMWTHQRDYYPLPALVGNDIDIDSSIQRSTGCDGHTIRVGAIGQLYNWLNVGGS